MLTVVTWVTVAVMAIPGTPLLAPSRTPPADHQGATGISSHHPAPSRCPPPGSAGARAVSDALVVDHVPLVRHAVQKAVSRLPGHVAGDDLHAAGMLALVEASRAFDPHRGVPFAAFAVRRVTGAVLDELRRGDWAPRSVRRRERELDQVRTQLTVALHQPPTRGQLAAATGLSTAQLSDHTRDLTRASLGSLQQLTGDTVDGMLGARPVEPDAVLLHRERLAYLRDAVTALPDRLRRVIDGAYFQDTPGAVLAAELGVSQARISQLRVEALALLRHGLNAVLHPGAAVPTGPVTGATHRRRVEYVTRLATLHTPYERLRYVPDSELHQVA